MHYHLCPLCVHLSVLPFPLLPSFLPLFFPFFLPSISPSFIQYPSSVCLDQAHCCGPETQVWGPTRAGPWGFELSVRHISCLFFVSPGDGQGELGTEDGLGGWGRVQTVPDGTASRAIDAFYVSSRR